MRQPNTPRTLAQRWLVLFFLVTSMLLSSCNLDNLPASKRNNNVSGSNGATPTEVSRLGQQGSQGQTSGGSGSGGSSGSSSSAPAQGGSWQVPAEQQAAVQVVERASPAVVTVVNKLD